MRILHLEDDPADSIFIERGVLRQGIEAAFIQARSVREFTDALRGGGFDVVLVDNGLPGFTARDAIVLAKSSRPDVPVIVCSGAAREADVAASLAAGAADYVLKDHLWQLAASLRRISAAPATAPQKPPESTPLVQQEAMLLLVEVVQKLSLARGLDDIIAIVRRAARQLAGSDGATFVLRDGEYCYYVDEDAVSPLWKGQRFPLATCVSGWAMLNRKPALIPDIYQDPRVPHDAYRPTFVRSLAMTPIRSAAPIGAIGVYWASRHECTPEELMLLAALANTTAVAMENVSVYQGLEKQVRERTRELQAVNEELEAFSSAVAHDLRAPLRAMRARLDEALEREAALPVASVAEIREAAAHMGGLIEDLLRLSRISHMELQPERIDLGELASRITDRLRAAEPSAQAQIHIEPGMTAQADPGLMGVVLENLLSNAWKYSAKRAMRRIEFTSRLDERGRRQYCISDNGAGFDERQAERLFKPFARLHDAREFPGVGVGLATVHRVIQRHGGEISAHSDGRDGAQFIFTLGD